MNHPASWPASSLILGAQKYSAAELAALLNLPVKGDASIDLAHQLIAAKLNVLNGVNPATDSGAIAAADRLLSLLPGRLPFGVGPDAQMTTVASALNFFNSDGKAQPGCVVKN